MKERNNRLARVSSLRGLRAVVFFCNGAAGGIVNREYHRPLFTFPHSRMPRVGVDATTPPPPLSNPRLDNLGG